MVKGSLICREGILSLKGQATDNQCVKQAYPAYAYELKVLFPGDTKLNKQNFIINHQIFHDAIQDIPANSCEIISGEILDIIEKVLKSNNLKCIGMSLKIRPVEQNAGYFKGFRCVREKNLALIISL